MTTEFKLVIELLIWTIAAGVFFGAYLKNGDSFVGMGLSYIAILWIIHCPTAAIYMSGWNGFSNPQEVEQGFRQSTFGAVFFSLAFFAIAPTVRRNLRERMRRQLVPRETPNLPAWYLAVGLATYIALLPLTANLPTIRAIVSVGWQFITIGFALAIWRARLAGNRPRMFFWLSAAFGLPVMTAVTTGFMGHGMIIVINLLSFFCVIYRPRRVVLATIVVVAYVTSSFYVTYMRDRPTLRKAVWGGKNLSTRISIAQSTLENFEFFNTSNPRHLELVDGRLNQNALVGAAVNYIKQGSKPFAHGSTIRDAVLALVPRALWPEKPVAAGSMRLATEYTGIQFDRNTSVGMGQVFEFYINFGVIGVIAGFLLIGALVGVIDMVAADHLRAGEWRAFAAWYLPGVCLLQVGGSLVDITASVAAAVINVAIVNRLIPVPSTPKRTLEATALGASADQSSYAQTA